MSGRSDANKNSLLAGTGKMGKLISAHDWGKTDLGPIDTWPTSLLTSVNTILRIPLPAVVLWGKDGIMLYNDGYAKFAAKRHPGILGMKVRDAWPEVQKFNQHVLDECLAGKSLSYNDWPITLNRLKNDEEFWMDLSYSPIHGENGKPAGVFALILDVTERNLARRKQKAAEDTLLLARKRLYSLFMDAPAIIATLRGPDHIFELANPRFMKLVGRKASIIGKSARNVLPELTSQGIFDMLDQVYKTGEPYFGNEQLVALDRGKGSLQPGYFNFVCQPSYDEHGMIDGVFVHAVEVTDQVNARKHAEESEEHFRFMAETLPLKIFTSSADGKITYFNPQWEEFTGLPMNVLYRDGVRQFMHPEDHDHSMNAWRKALKTGKPLENEQRLRRHDGQYRRHISYAKPMRDKSGKIISWFGSMTDIEDVLQAALQKDKLELVAANLQEQHAQLVAINRVKDEFIALASHQLRTPATAVKQYIDLVLSGFFGPLTIEQTRNLQIAYESNERELNIINDLLKTAQIDSNSYVLHKEPQSLADLVRQVIEELYSALELKHQTVIFKDESNNAKVAVDKEEVKLVFINLLENASKYSHEGKAIKITVKKKDKSLVVEFNDKGVGIDTKYTKQIFEKFTRINNELSDTVTGSGLGLYWVKQIIMLHNGTINVRSTPGKGSSFIVKLPL